ncbi:flavin-containing monooxygenase [Pontitalea aquivivens]|uniref:flavin-containing monooxygenase n=1 Tax=Pontitalea aquivivens TaxID=3388663 RepID=UPI003970751D
MKDHLTTALKGSEADRAITQGWLSSFNTALQEEDQAAACALFLDNAYWRDLLAHQWDFRSLTGPTTFVPQLLGESKERGVRNFSIDPRYTEPTMQARSGRQVIEAIIRFDTDLGPGSGILRLQEVPEGSGQWLAWGLMTSLQGLSAHPEKFGDNRPVRVPLRNPGENWTDQIRQNSTFESEEPEVLVVGGGHSGVMVAARLRAMGVRVLTIDALPRLGDVWRNRYHTLQLHNEIFSIDFPYLRYPETWPVFLPKDMYADWIEFYARAMELAVWTSTRFEGAERDEAAGCWIARLLMADGSQRVLRPKHIIMATGGVSGRKSYPKLPGLENFKGTVAHSADVRPNDSFSGKKAIVVGTSTSGHDIALELTERGCQVTMVQRSPTVVVNIDPANLIYNTYKEGRSIDEIDVVTIANNFDATIQSYRLFTEMVEKMDKNLLDGLHKIGFKTDRGYLDGGYFANYLHRGGGYYLNVGASDQLISGKIGLIQNDQIQHYEANGARLMDGSLLDADIVVLATGYMNQETDIHDYFGSDVARRVGKVWGWDEGGELRRAWRPTGQEGLWLQLGGVPQCRTYSKFLALQIVAELRGIKAPTKA